MIYFCAVRLSKETVTSQVHVRKILNCFLKIQDIHTVQHVLPSSKSTFSITNRPLSMLKGGVYPSDTSQICLNYQFSCPSSGGRRERWVCLFQSHLQIPQLSTQRQDSTNLVLSRPQQTPCSHLNILVESRFCLPKADYGRALFHNPISQRALSHSRLFLIIQGHVIWLMYDNLSEIYSKLF